jgi:hypothetical protein
LFSTELSRSESEGGEEEIFFDSTLRQLAELRLGKAKRINPLLQPPSPVYGTKVEKSAKRSLTSLH